MLNGAERAPLTDNAWRRHAAGCFIAVYATLRDLEIALTDMVQALNHSSSTSNANKIAIRWKPNTLLAHK
jgi:hypothetical protein